MKREILIKYNQKGVKLWKAYLTFLQKSAVIIGAEIAIILQILIRIAKDIGIALFRNAEELRMV